MINNLKSDEKIFARLDRGRITMIGLISHTLLYFFPNNCQADIMFINIYHFIRPFLQLALLLLQAETLPLHSQDPNLSHPQFQARSQLTGSIMPRCTGLPKLFRQMLILSLRLLL